MVTSAIFEAKKNPLKMGPNLQKFPKNTPSKNNSHTLPGNWIEIKWGPTQRLQLFLYLHMLKSVHHTSIHQVKGTRDKEHKNQAGEEK